MKTARIALLSFPLLMATVAKAAPVDDLISILRNRTGEATEDRRSDVKTGPVKIGCKGDTLRAGVRITDVSGRMDGDTAYMTVTYQGEYTRQGWDVPCVQVPGREELGLSGSYTFTVTGKAFQRPVINWGTPTGLGQRPEPGHDSNVFAIRAVQNAIAGAF